VNADDGEAIVEIFAELTFGDALFEIRDTIEAPDELDQDQRAPWWRRERFHDLDFDRSAPTQGGLLYSPARGTFLIVEAVRQLRGQAGEVQVPDCNVAIACGSGGWLSAIGAAILGKEHP